MSSSFKILTVGGVAIRLHITFPLILVWAAAQFGFLGDGGLSGALFGVAVVTLLFVIIVLHELGHSAAALRLGVPVDQIVLLPIGGVAQLRRMPRQPLHELAIAIAGPAVNLILAIVLLFPALALNRDVSAWFDVFRGMPNVPISFTSVFFYVFLSNIFLLLFNLLPAFPMDGGRVLRSLLATRLPYARATAIAVSVGRAMAWLFGLYGFINFDLFVILLAFFVYMGASQEGALERARSILSGLTVRQAYSRDVQSLSPADTLQSAVNLTLTSFQANFPVCDGQQLVGLLTYPDLVKALGSLEPGAPVSEVMSRQLDAVSPDDELFDVQQRFKERGVDALPVVADGQFVGLITSRDVGEVYSLISVEPGLLPRT